MEQRHSRAHPLLSDALRRQMLHFATLQLKDAAGGRRNAGEKLLPAVHTMMCNSCRNFEQPLPVIRSVFRAWVERTDDTRPDEDTTDKPNRPPDNPPRHGLTR